MHKLEILEQRRGEEVGVACGRRFGEEAHSRTPLLLAVVFGLGIGVSAFWFSQHTKGEAERTPKEGPVTLSAATRAVLERLDVPVELRFYAVLDPATVPAAEVAFAGRVDRLLSAYQEAGHGKIKLTHIQERQGSGRTAADVDGMQPFNLEKGDACFLGLAIACKGVKESLPRLLPEWEPALEPDVTRAIARVLQQGAPSAAPSVTAPPDPAVIEEVRHLVPQWETVSLQEGMRVLRQAALEKFAVAANELQSKVDEARQRLSQAQQGKSDTEQQAAMQHLQQVEAEQGQKLKEIAARSQAQVRAFEQLKRSTR